MYIYGASSELEPSEAGPGFHLNKQSIRIPGLISCRVGGEGGVTAVSMLSLSRLSPCHRHNHSDTTRHAAPYGLCFFSFLVFLLMRQTKLRPGISLLFQDADVQISGCSQRPCACGRLVARVIILSEVMDELDCWKRHVSNCEFAPPLHPQCLAKCDIYV